MIPGARGQEQQRGSASLWVALGAVIILMVFGLIVDGADKVAAGRTASVAAAEAARAGGQSMSAATVISGQPQAAVDPAKGVQAARAYLAATGVTGSVAVSGDAITVNTSVPWKPRFLPGPGQTLTGTSTATRTSVR